MYIAAIYTKGGRIVTGTHHGEAFGKMTIEEQDGIFSSGFYDPKTGEFVTDQDKFYIKQLLLIRHAEVNQDANDPELSDSGRLQARSLGEILSEKLDLSGFMQFSAVATRCQQTANILDSYTHLGVECLSCLQDINAKETPQSFIIRLKNTLDQLPEKSIVISHCNCILNLAQLALGLEDISTCPKWNGILPFCSVTFIKKREAVWIGQSFHSSNMPDRHEQQQCE